MWKLQGSVVVGIGAITSLNTVTVSWEKFVRKLPVFEQNGWFKAAYRADTPEAVVELEFEGEVADLPLPPVLCMAKDAKTNAFAAIKAKSITIGP